SHEQNVIELSRNFLHVVHRALFELDFQVQSLRREARLTEIAIVHINAQHPPRPALLHLDGIEPAITPNVENCCSRKILRQSFPNVLPLNIRKIAEKMMWRRRHAMQIHVMKPLPKLSYAAFEVLRIEGTWRLLLDEGV